MKRIAVSLLSIGAVIAAAAPLRADTSADRLAESATVLKEITNAPDKGIPRDLLDKASCVIIVPGVKKAAFIVGGKYGKGFMICRKSNNPGWGSPAAIRMEGGSVGFQIGGSETDVVMLIMDRSGKNSLLRSKFTLGGDISVAGGPVGRSSSAETDAQMRAKILSYSRSRGVFAGIALNGATLREDTDDNKELYGRPLTNREIINGNISPPASAAELIGTLDRLSRLEKR
jgi:lipid-binding SYLF domain-containing protein